ncbi:MAG: hypothetical protein KDB00_05500, partial [Planctomycetales bacterium]|nr:hypothetical protein [Planctomycetales bacterium]
IQSLEKDNGKFAQQQIAGDYRAQVERYSQRLQQSQNAPMSTPAPADETSQAMGMGGGLGMPMAGAGPSNENAAAAPAGPQNSSDRPVAMQEGFLASLEVDLPARGKEFMFTTPGGNLELSVRSITNDFRDRVYACLATVFLALLVLAVWRFALPRFESVSSNRLVEIALVVAGMASVVAGILPIYGILMILVAITMHLHGSQEPA